MYLVMYWFAMSLQGDRLINAANAQGNALGNDTKCSP